MTKFRAWDKINKRMIYGPTPDSPSSSWILALPDEGVEKMKSIGFKDKDGKEIYECDYIYIKHPFYSGIWDTYNVYLYEFSLRAILVTTYPPEFRKRDQSELKEIFRRENYLPSYTPARDLEDVLTENKIKYNLSNGLMPNTILKGNAYENPELDERY